MSIVTFQIIMKMKEDPMYLTFYLLGYFSVNENVGAIQHAQKILQVLLCLLYDGILLNSQSSNQITNAEILVLLFVNDKRVED